MTKVCTKCKIEKSIDEFHRCTRDGYQSRCKQCRSIKKPNPLADRGLRQCTLCKEIKVLKTDFYERKKGSGLYKSQCKPCYMRRSMDTCDKEKARARARRYYREKQPYQNDLNYKMKLILRTRLNVSIKKNVKRGSAVRDLGCSIAELKAYLESQFEEGMTWDNWTRDGWHIDHIVPLFALDLNDPEQVKKACHYTNLRPMWAIDNYRKGGTH